LLLININPAGNLHGSARKPDNSGGVDSPLATARSVAAWISLQLIY